MVVTRSCRHTTNDYRLSRYFWKMSSVGWEVGGVCTTWFLARGNGAVDGGSVG